MMVEAVVARDFPMIQGGVLVVATLYVVVNAATDALAIVVNPRLRVKDHALARFARNRPRCSVPGS